MQTKGVRGQKMPRNANVICERPLTVKKKTVNQLFNYSTVLWAAIKCTPYCEITVEIRTQLKTVKKNTTNIIAVYSAGPHGKSWSLKLPNWGHTSAYSGCGQLEKLILFQTASSSRQIENTPQSAYSLPRFLCLINTFFL